MLLQRSISDAQVQAIYNSRNFICSYSMGTADPFTFEIYNSRNFICSYSEHLKNKQQ